MALVLSGAERLVLESYRTLADGLADYLGEGYEIVVHSLEDESASVIKIVNGYYTGRSEGAPLTSVARRVLGQIEEEDGYLTFFSRGRKGEPLKSATIAIRGDGGRVIGLLSLNFYLNTSLYALLEGFSMPAEVASREEAADGARVQADGPVDRTILQVRAQVMENPEIPALNKNKEIIARLREKGVFGYKEGVSRTAEILGVSRNTVYMHIRNAK